MNARAISADVVLGIVPLALVIALWQALISFGYAPVSLLPPPGLVFARLSQQLVSGGFLHEIGATLFISEHTVANHIRSILQKTGCANRTEAASYAHRHALAPHGLRLSGSGGG